MIILALYGWVNHLSNNPQLAETLYITSVTATLAGVTTALALVFYIKTPKKYTFHLSALLYGLLVLTTGTLIIQSDGVHSPFIALWMAVSVFAGLYGLYGIGAVLVLVNVYLIYSFTTSGIGRENIIVAAIAGELPMFISYILWNGRESLEEARDRDVSSLSKSLEQESSKSGAIIEAIGDGVIVVDQGGKIMVINPAAQQMTGWSSEDAHALHYDSVLKLQTGEGEPVNDALNPIARVLNVGQQVRSKDLCIITKSGKKIYAAFVVSPLGSARDGAIAVFRDITKELDDERAQAEFISTASHEMRTPVASIEGYLGLALNPNTATIDEKARDFITKAHASAQHLGRLFQDLLDVTRADDGRLKEDPRVTEVVEFTRTIADGLRMKATEKGLDIIYQPDGTKADVGTTVISPVLYAHIDNDHLREVIDNLIENAIKYTLKGTITIDVTAPSEEYVRISVQDSGLGIPAEDLPHLFQKFYRVDNSETREIGGTGLGLYLCRKLVESMDGRIWVESEYKKGSTFFVEIPRIDRNEANTLIEREQRANTRAQTSAITQSLPTPVMEEVINTPATPQVTSDPQQLGTVVHAVEIPTPPPQEPSPEAPQPTPAQTPPPLTTAAPSPTPPAPAPVPATPATPTPAPRFGAVSYQATTQPQTQPQTQAPAAAEIPLATPGAPDTPPTTQAAQHSEPAAVHTSQPTQPIAPPEAVPITPAPQMSTHPRPSPARENVPLSVLERDREQYVIRRPKSS